MKRITIFILLAWVFFKISMAQNFSVLGTGNLSNSAYTFPTPFGNYYWGARQQFFFSASELLAAGVVPGASISSLGFHIVNGNGAAVHNNFQIVAYTTPANLNSGAWYMGTAAGQTSPQNFPSGGVWPTGWVQFTFNTPFSWNGGDNLIVETCFQNNSYLVNASTLMTSMPPGNVYTLAYYSDMLGICSSSVPPYAGFMDRPNIRLEWTATACSGMPNPGSTLASSQQVCPSQSITLSLQNYPSGTGILYAWESSTDGGITWNSLGTGSPVVSQTVSVATQFRCVVTCTNSGLSATSTPVQVDVTTDPCQCGSFPASYASYPDGPDLVQVQIGSFVNSSQCQDLSGASGSMPGQYNDYTTLASGPSAFTGSLVNFSLSADICNFGSYFHLKLFADWNQDGDFNDSDEEVYASPVPFTLPGTTSGNFWVPVNAPPGSARLRVIAMAVWSLTEPNMIEPDIPYDYGETEDYCLNIQLPPACSGQPAPGSTEASTSQVCVNQPVLLSLPGLTPGLGYQYQWQQSTDGGLTWTGFGPNQPYVTTSITASALFRCEVTCLNSGLSDLSVPVQVILNTNDCQCNSYSSSAASDSWDSDILSVTVGNLTHSSLCQDQAPGPGSMPGMYSNFTASVAPATVYQGFPVSFSVEAGQCGGFTFPHLKIFADWNQDGDFNDSGEEVFATTSPLSQPGLVTGSFFVPATAVSGATRLRLVLQNVWGPQEPNPIMPEGTYYYGETEDYCVDVQTPVGCSGTPSPGTTSASATTGCPGMSVQLSLPGLAPATGLTFQWQQSTDGGATWTNFGPNQAQVQTMVNVNTQFRCQVTCSNSGSSAHSTPVTVTVGGDNCQCLSYAASGAMYPWDGEILQVTVGTMANSSVCGQSAPGPGSVANQYGNYTGSLPGPAHMAGTNVNFSIEVGTCNGSYNHFLKIFADWNQDGDFGDGGETVYTTPAAVVPPQTVSGSFIVPLNAVPGVTRLRIVLMETWDSSMVMPEGLFAYGETEDYCFTVIPLTPCSGTPNPGNTLASTPEACPFQPFTLQISNDLSMYGGISYQWQRSTDGGSTWSNFGPSAPSVTAIQSTSTLYRCQVTCSASGLTGSSSELNVPVGTPCVCQNYNASLASHPDNTYIYQVKIGGVINNSSCGTLAPGPGSVPDQYSNYTGYLGPFEVENGKPFNFTVGVGTCNQGMVSVFKIFIDWNGDGDFTDTGEEAFTSGNLNGGQLVSGTITAPTMNPLVTRLRVVCVETPIASVVTPTGTYNYGETEDYCLSIKSNLEVPESDNSPSLPDRAVVMGDQILLFLQDGAASGEVVVKILDLTGRILQIHQLGYTGPGTYALGRYDLPSGLYILYWTYNGKSSSQRLVLAKP